MIAELVRFNALETTTDEQLLSQGEILCDFQKNLDGFIDAELTKGTEGNAWYFIYHYTDMDHVKVIGEKMRSSNIFAGFMPLIVPGSLNVTFHTCLKKW